MAKTYNVVTGPRYKYVEPRANRMASSFLDGCNHLTPATEAELDNLFIAMNRNAPEAEAGVCEPDPEVLAAFEESEAEGKYDWMDNVEPPMDMVELVGPKT